MHGGWERKRVLIVDSLPVVAHATQQLLSKMDNTLSVTVCTCAQTAVEEVQRFHHWFRIFLDPSVPQARGFGLAHQLCEYGVAKRCAVITAIDNPTWREEAKSIGMLGYIMKAMPVEKFESALHAVLNGRLAFSPSNSINTYSTRLTKRQQQVLSLLHCGYSSKQIAAHLEISEGTVDNHVTALLRALGVTNRTHAIAKAIELKYV